MNCQIDETGLFVCDAPFAEQSQTIVPHDALDGTTPDGMRKAKWTGTWDATTSTWSTGGWVDEEAASLASDLQAQTATQARQQRDALLSATDWLVRRHKDESEAGTATSLTAAQYTALQAYRQSLRNWPAGTGFPDTSTLPASPI